MSINKGIHDLVYDQIVTILKTAAESQPEGYEFDVYDSAFRMQTPRKDASVFVVMEGLSNQREGSATHSHHEFEARYIIDMVCTARGRKAGETYEGADARASARLRMLVQQVMNILWHGENIDLGLPVKYIANRHAPNVNFFDTDQVQSERPIVGARMNMSVRIPFQPEGIDGPELTEIGISITNPPVWAVEITPDEGEQ